jgi:hypothetical protein
MGDVLADVLSRVDPKGHREEGGWEETKDDVTWWLGCNVTRPCAQRRGP